MKQRQRTELIVVHCSATPPKMDIGVEEIRRWHRAKGWIDVGYHFVIRRSGLVEVGRAVDVVGAHVEGSNAISVGVCMVGGTSADDPRKAKADYTDEQWAALRDTLRTLMDRYPGVRIVGHNEMTRAKACPSFDVQAWLKDNPL